MPTVNLLYIIEGGSLGGAEQNILTILKIIDRTRYNIKVCLLKPSDVIEHELRALDIPVFVLHMAGKRDIASLIKLIRFIKRERIDIVHSSLYVPNTFGRIAAILARAPIKIAWEQGEVFIHPPRHHKVNRFLAKFTDCIVVCSKACKEEIIKKENIPAYKIRTIYNCVDLDRFNALSDTSAIRKQLGITDDEILLGTVASLANAIKGQEYIIKSIPQIIKTYPQTKLILVGEGLSKSYFVELINSLNIKDKVILTGFRRNITEIMNALDIYVSSSIYEALGISIIEAMSLKKPVVATDVGGVSEVVINGQTGCLVPSKDVDSLAQAVTDLLANREKMRQMGEAGFDRVKKHFSSELITKEIEVLYRELLWKIRPKSQ